MKSTQGKPIIQVNVPYIFQLEYDEAGREAVKLVLDKYKGTKVALNTFNVEDQDPVKGSNIYSRFALANAYRELTKEDIMPIDPRQSEIALANGTLTDPTSTYEDLGLIVYPAKGANPVLWGYLRTQVKGDFPKVNLNKPFIITGLADVFKNSGLENELGLELNELTEVYNVPILSKGDGTFDTNDPQLQKTGFLSRLGKGKRDLYTAKDGVRGFDRDRNVDLNARLDGLAGSDGTGRVHLAKNFSSGNLGELVSNLEQEKLKKLEELKKHYEIKIKKVQDIKF